MPHDSETTPARLDAIPTQWSLIQRAHAAGQGQQWQAARQQLILRYAPAIRKYLGALLRQDYDADELAQDILVKLLQGDFAGADPTRGRFRDFLKTALRNQVRKRWEKEKRRKPTDLDWQQLAGGNDPAEDAQWLAAWQRQVLDQAWAALERFEKEQPGNLFARLLRLRVELAEATSDELAATLSQRTGKPITADNVRQQLRRARLKFVELLKEEVAAGLDTPTEERLEEEFAALGLASYLQQR